MVKSSDPWYVHAILYAIIVVLTFLLIKVAILDPKETVQMEKYWKKESRLRMNNLKEAEILWFKKYGHYTGSLDSLINFIKTDSFVDSVMNSFDSLTRKPANPFTNLTNGNFVPDSLYRTPKTQERYIVEVDTSTQVDSVVNNRGRLLRVDTTTAIGSLYYIEDPAGYGTVGSIDDIAKKNTPSWEK